jgi:hypothetical protein
MSDITTATWTTYIRGERMQIPATIAGIRAMLPEEKAAEFDAEIEATPAPQLTTVLARWALPAEAIEEDDEVVARLRAGDFSGCVPAAELHEGAA